MNPPPRKSEPEALRRRAEQQLGAPPSQSTDATRLVHELEVHQVELQLQNEELRGAREEMERALRRYRELFEFAPVGYAVLDAAGCIREVNLAGARLLGMVRAQVVGRPLGCWVAVEQHADFSAFLGSVLARTRADGPSEAWELMFRVEGEAPCHVVLTGSALEGQERAALVAMEDVTQRRRAEEALREEVRNKDAFLAMLSHELRNPLAPIRNSLFVAQRRLSRADPVYPALEIMDRQVTQLTHIVDDLLDVTRVARGKIRLQLQRVELGALVARGLEDHRGAFESAGVALHGPRGAGDLWADADPTRLAQVLGNLLGNAVKFTPRGGQVEVSLEREGSTAELRVRDSGPGIAPELQARLFQPFSQAPQTLDRSRGGLGLGLALARGLVEQHGGTIRLHSVPGQGATFTVRLPLVDVAPLERPAGTAGALPRHRVLVIEDHTDAADSLRDVLSLLGQEACVTYEGTAGLAKARELRPDVVLCDLGLPGMDGFQVARAIREDPALRRTFLVAVSGYAQTEDVQRALSAGFDGHLSKPPDVDRLRGLLAQVTSRP